MRIQEHTQITFDDVLIKPQFSTIESRADCSTATNLMGLNLSTPILSANMDLVTEDVMANKMDELYGIGVLHRFQTIEQNILMFKKAPNSWCSFGIGETEFARLEQLYYAGCNHFVLDVAHGASKVAADQYILVKKHFPEAKICVGNFATSESILAFVNYVVKNKVGVPDAFKVGIGGGSMCTTRVVTGVGIPQLASIIDCVSTGYPIIADGGIKNSGDYAKAMACGAKAVMLGSMLAGTTETPGDRIFADGSKYQWPAMDKTWKKYRGSASAESYAAQGKIADHRAAEGESTLIPYKGDVENIIKQMQAGLKSSMSYVGASNLAEFREQSILVKVSGNTHRENGAHGKI